MTLLRFEHALIVGKFYPPHHGHEYLIRTALGAARQVSVLVLASSQENLPMQARAEWLRRCFPNSPQLRVRAALDDVAIDYHDAVIWAAHVAIMRDALAELDAVAPAPAVDVVFSSEAYGAELARHFQARHVCLDATRALYPISSTRARADLAGSWEFLPHAVREGLCLRVVVVGAESSGTTTLTRALCSALRARGGVWQRTTWVPEYGREFSANQLALLRAVRPHAAPRDIVWEESDFVQIAEEQTRLETIAAPHGSPVLLCDTDAFATGIWHERYRGATSAAVDAIVANLPPRGLYLLTDPADVPFEDDGLRDGEHLRPWMHARFAQALSARAVPWFTLSGTPEARLVSALSHVDRAFDEHRCFAQPLGERNSVQSL